MGLEGRGLHDRGWHDPRDRSSVLAERTEDDARHVREPGARWPALLQRHRAERADTLGLPRRAESEPDASIGYGVHVDLVLPVRKLRPQRVPLLRAIPEVKGLSWVDLLCNLMAEGCHGCIPFFPAQGPRFF